MKAQAPTNFLKSMLTPAQRAEGLVRLKAVTDDMEARLKANHERQSREAAAINELEQGECKDES